MLTEQILALLRARGGSYVSGEAMSRALGVSRAAVWKGVEALRREGCEISSAPRRGYRLESGPSRLTAWELEPKLRGLTLGREVVCLETVDSTSSEVKRRAQAGAAEGLVVVSEEQTQGRGRRGNGFSSPKGKGLYLSVLLRPGVSLAELNTLTARAAVAVCRGIEAACGAQAGIKWTNDLVLGGKKLCGILTELELEVESGALGYVVLGVGINVSQSREDFSPELEEVATSLALEGHAADRAALAAAVLGALDGMYRVFPGEGEAYWAEYRARCVTLGREVLILGRGEPETAFAEDLNADFSLLIRRPDGRREAVSAGEVSVRGLMGYV